MQADAQLMELVGAHSLQQPLLLSPGKVAQLAVCISCVPQRSPLGLGTNVYALHFMAPDQRSDEIVCSPPRQLEASSE